ncbi:hypothetical protein B0H14DRAFT_2602585 [Mycena olivaceomarginata]|nr:hypothetical protein B0H14DRAFT_2602585 [Mycena olivaceomarginata]
MSWTGGRGTSRVWAKNWVHISSGVDSSGLEKWSVRKEPELWQDSIDKSGKDRPVLPVVSTSNDSPKSDSLSGGFRNDRRQGASKCIGGSGNQRQDLTARQSRNGAVWCALPKIRGKFFGIGLASSTRRRAEKAEEKQKEYHSRRRESADPAVIGLGCFKLAKLYFGLQK